MPADRGEAIAQELPSACRGHDDDVEQRLLALPRVHVLDTLAMSEGAWTSQLATSATPEVRSLSCRVQAAKRRGPWKGSKPGSKGRLSFGPPFTATVVASSTRAIGAARSRSWGSRR